MSCIVGLYVPYRFHEYQAGLRRVLSLVYVVYQADSLYC